MKLVAELIKIKNQSPDKYQGYIQTLGSKEKELCDPKFNKRWEVYIYNKVSNNLKTIYDEVLAFEKSPLTADSQIEGFNRIINALEIFGKNYDDYNQLMGFHKYAFNNTALRIVSEEKRTLYNYLKQNKNNIVLNSELVLSKFINIVKNKPMTDLDMADIVISKMQETFQLSAERELYVAEKVSHRKHSHKAL